MQIKGKFESKRGEDHLASHFGELIRVEREGEEEEEEEEEGEESQRKVWNLLSFVWILVWKYGFLWISLDFVWILYGKKKSNHKPIFDEFGSKRTLLGILVVFWTWVG